MKKFLIFCMLIIPLFSCAKSFNFTNKSVQNDYLDYFNQINLSEKQKEEILKIQKEEELVLSPLILDIHSHELGIKYLEGLSCGIFELTCKKKLKKDIEDRKIEKDEIMRKINIKKNYFEIRYKNVLTREQNHQLQQIKESKTNKKP